MRSPYYKVRFLTSKMVIFLGSLMAIILGFRLSHGQDAVHSFIGIFLVVSGAQIALWTLGVRLEMLANTSADVTTLPISSYSGGGLYEEGGESDIYKLEQFVAARIDDLEKSVTAKLKDWELSEEQQVRVLEGRTLAANGYVMAELSIEPGDPLRPSSKDRLERAVDLCRQAYEILVKVGGAAEMMALNNLVYYSSILNDITRRDFLLSKARLLLEVGEERGSINLLLTACLAILQFEEDPRERSRAREVLSAIEKLSRATNREQREASLYLEHFPVDHGEGAKEAPNLEPQADS